MNRYLPFLFSLITPAILLGYQQSTAKYSPAPFELQKDSIVVPDTIFDDDNDHIPVELINFDAYLKNRQVVLHWQTASELNAMEFELRRSFDGQSWETLAILPAAGNSQTLRSYRYTDNHPGHGTNYYQLIQRDLDGIVKLVKNTAIHWKDKNSVRIYPNPLKGNALHVHTPFDTEMTIYNEFGQQIQAIRLSVGTNAVEMHHLPAGVYFLQTGNREQATVKVVRE